MAGLSTSSFRALIDALRQRELLDETGAPIMFVPTNGGGAATTAGAASSTRRGESRG